MGAAFVVYASEGRPLLNLGTVMGGFFIVFGVVLALLVQRHVRELDRSA
jgi:hypothetical protein